VELRERALGPEHPDTATSLNNLAVLYYQLEHWLERNNARPTSESAASPQKNPGVAYRLGPNNETGPFELSILQRKAQWLHEVQRRFRRQSRPMFPVFGGISGSTKQH
jgi:hypothetical protein